MNSVFTPIRSSHSRTAREVNSGPETIVSATGAGSFLCINASNYPVRFQSRDSLGGGTHHDVLPEAYASAAFGFQSGGGYIEAYVAMDDAVVPVGQQATVVVVAPTGPVDDIRPHPLFLAPAGDGSEGDESGQEAKKPASD